MNRYTSKQLADFLLPGYPTTSVGWDKLLAREGWEFVEEHGRGRGGLRREYLPPPEVQMLINARLRGELPPAPTVPDNIKKSRADRLREKRMEVVRKSLHSPPPGHREVAGEGGFFVPDGFSHVPTHDDRYPLGLLLETAPDDVDKLPDYMSSGSGRMLLPLYPSLTVRVSEALFKTYGAAYNSLDEETRKYLFEKIYSFFCQLGVSETVAANVEDIETVLKLVIKYGIAPMPTKDAETPTSKEISKAIWEAALEQNPKAKKALEDAKKEK